MGKPRYCKVGDPAWKVQHHGASPPPPPARPLVSGVARLMKARCVGGACDAQASAGVVRSPAAGRPYPCVASRCAALPLHRRSVSLYMRMHTALPIYRRPYDAHTIWYGGYVPQLYWPAVQPQRMGRRLYYRCMGRLYCVLGCTRLYGLRVQSPPVHPSQYGCTRVVRLQLYCSCRRCYGAYATALLLRAIHLLCCLYAVCMRVRLLILCCCMYVGAPAAAAVAMLWRRSDALHTRRWVDGRQRRRYRRPEVRCVAHTVHSSARCFAERRRRRR